MPLLNVGLSYNLGTLCPFGPFNRIVNSPTGIYLESGMLKYGMAYFKPESYMPAAYQYNSAFTKIVGTIYLESRLEPALLAATYPALIYVAKSVTYALANGKHILESRAIGCDDKSDTVRMINPRGDEAVCSYRYESAFPPSILIPNPASLGSLMSYVDVLAILGKSYYDAGNGGTLYSHCIKPEKTSVDYKQAGNKVFCSSGIMDKKFCRTLYPPSVFSGKLRLYIQCVYGGRELNYELDGGASALKSLKVGLHPELIRKDAAPRVAVFGRGTHWLFTYNFHHFLISTSSLNVNPLVPLGIGHQLKKHLQNNPRGLSQELLDNLEAYLLSVSAPTYTISPPGKPSNEIFKYGRPFDFGLNGNWSGNSAVMVVHNKNNANYRISTTVQVTTTCTGLEDVLEQELMRKCQSLILDQRVKQGVATYPFGVYRRYITDALYTESGEVDSFGDKKYVIFGDVEDGFWWYAVHIAVGDEQYAQEKALWEEEAKQKNKIWGGQPYTEECFTAMAACFSFSVSNERSPPWIEPLEADKIFTWDAFYNDYMWNVPCGGHNNPCKEPNEGSFPVYAWYDRTGNMIIANYVYRNMSKGEDIHIPPEGMCGPGHDEEHTKNYDKGSESGWQVNTVKAVKQSFGYNRYDGDWTIDAGRWEPGWNASCGMNFCDGNSCPPGGGVSDFYTHWYTYRLGPGQSKTETGVGSQGQYTFLLIPKDDCQALHIGGLSTSVEHTRTNQKKYKDCGNALQCCGIVDQGTIKLVGSGSGGWVTCFGLFFSKWFGHPGITPIDRSEFASVNWCFFKLPPGSEIGVEKCPFRKWGKDGTDTGPTVGLITPWFGAQISEVEKTFITVSQQTNGYYINSKGQGFETSNSGGSGTSPNPDDYWAFWEAWGAIKLDTTYAPLLKELDLDWPYAGCGSQYSSFTTINNEGMLCRVIGAKPETIPKPWPFDSGFIYAVGYV